MAGICDIYLVSDLNFGLAKQSNSDTSCCTHLAVCHDKVASKFSSLLLFQARPMMIIILLVMMRYTQNFLYYAMASTYLEMQL